MKNLMLLISLLMFSLFGLSVPVFNDLRAEESASAPTQSEPTQKSVWKQYHQQKNSLEQKEKEEQTFNAGAHFELACWCLRQKNNKTLRKYGVKELLQIMEREPDYQPAQALLKRLDYVKHQDQWIPFKNMVKIKERAVTKLIRKVAKRDEAKRAEAIEALKEYEFGFKLRPLIKALEHRSEKVRLYCVNELKASQDKTVMPYLAKASLIDGQESVCQAALAAVKTFDVESIIPWYGYFIQTAGNQANGLTRVRAANILGDLGYASATPYLIRSMHGILMEIRLQKTELVPGPPNLKNIREDICQGSTPRNVTIELPDIRYISIRTTVRTPGSVSYSLEAQLDFVGNALENITGQKFGDDYNQWFAWYKENRKEEEKEEATKDK